MRMISSNLFLKNLDLAKTQAEALIYYLNNKPYDTSHNIETANSVLQLERVMENAPAPRWGY